MTTSSAEKAAGQPSVAPSDKEKIEKRRALGRGLASLLPGPRVVAPAPQSGAGLQQGSSELRSEGQPRAAVPTFSAPTAAPASHMPALHVPLPVEEEGPVTIQAVADTRVPSNIVVGIPLESIDKNPYQTRYLFDREMLADLADSIRMNGVVQPIVVRPAEEEGRYILILGERRCRASKIAGKETIPAIVKRVSNQQAAEMTVIENLQRQDLNCLEQAEAFRVLSSHFSLTQAQIGERVGMSRESVSNYMRILKLPERTQQYLASGALGFTDARLLLALEDAEMIAKAADEVVNKHLVGEQIEDLVMQMRGLTSGPEKPKEQRGARWVDPNVRAAQTEIERLLGVRVRIRDRKGKGKIVIEYATVDDFERVVEALRRK